MTVSQSSTAAVLAFAAFQRSTYGQALFDANFYDGRTVVVCDSEETVEVTFERIQRHTPPVLVAVHFAYRSGKDAFRLFDMSPGEAAAPAIEVRQAHMASTIGMLADSLTPGRALRFHLTWTSVDVQPFALA